MVKRVLEQSSASGRSVTGSLSGVTGADVLYDQIEALEPKTELQRTLKTHCLALAVTWGRTRWLMYEQGSVSVSKPLLVVMVFWLTVTFCIWGVLASANKTILVTMSISALSAAGAIFLILEMYSPYQGLIQVPDAPLRSALAHLGS
jgi:hypothetical protein